MTRTTSASQRTIISSNPSRPPPPPTASGTSTTSPTKLIIFLCDTPIQTVKSQFGTYHDIFSTLFKRSLDQEAEARSERLGLEIESYDVVKGEYPTDEALKAADGVLLTGSGESSSASVTWMYPCSRNQIVTIIVYLTANIAASAYAPLPWIKSLTSYISQLPEAHPHLKVIGICFGHQIVANAFNSDASSSSKPAPSTETQATSSGSENGQVDEGRNLVEKSPYGWEIGVYDVELTECGKRVFGRDRQFIVSPLAISCQSLQEFFTSSNPSRKSTKCTRITYPVLRRLPSIRWAHRLGVRCKVSSASRLRTRRKSRSSPSKVTRNSHLL